MCHELNYSTRTVYMYLLNTFSIVILPGWNVIYMILLRIIRYKLWYVMICMLTMYVLNIVRPSHLVDPLLPTIVAVLVVNFRADSILVLPLIFMVNLECISPLNT